jgi:hypothetical protein
MKKIILLLLLLITFSCTKYIQESLQYDVKQDKYYTEFKYYDVDLVSHVNIYIDNTNYNMLRKRIYTWTNK